MFSNILNLTKRIRIKAYSGRIAISFLLLFSALITPNFANSEPLLISMAPHVAPVASDSKTKATRGSNQDEVVVRKCTVTSVHDGDSMRVRCPGFKKTIPIRLEQIDAPEIDQSYGIASRDYLRSICPKGKQAVVHDMGKDIYKRHLGRVFCNGVDANAALLQEGYAWVYDHYAYEQELYKLQDSAKTEKKGLWASKKDPVAPWDFRRKKRRK